MHRVWPLGTVALAVLLVGCGNEDEKTTSTASQRGGGGSTGTGPVVFYDWEPSVIGNPELPVPRAVAKERAGAKGVILGDQETSRYWAVAGKPALTGRDIESAEQGFDPVTNQPTVLIKLTGDGRARFQAATRAVARRAKSSGKQQHFAIVVDEKVVSRPFVDPQQYPNGIDGENGIQITGGYTVEEAKNLADRINSGG